MAVKRDYIIPKAPLGRILERAGAKRVSQGALDAFNDFLTRYARNISEQAIKIAKHSGRKTVHDGDIKLAARR